MICLSGFSETQRRAYILADNKLALNAGWGLELGECGEPGIERRDRTELGAPLRQPQPGAAGVLVVLAPGQEELDAVRMACHVLDREPRDGWRGAAGRAPALSSCRAAGGARA
jgi:hypothetical protein